MHGHQREGKVPEDRWPIYCNNSLTLGNLSSPVAVCSLWTKQEVLTRALDSSKYCVLGNLYSKDGINFLIRNILANPRIRFLVVCGKDRASSGTALQNLFRYGTDADHKIIEDGTAMDGEVDNVAIDLLRRSVSLIDMRGESELEVARRISGLELNMAPFSPHALVFPRHVPQVDTFPSEENVFVVRGRFVADVWVKILAKIMTFGRISSTQHSMTQKELLNLISVVEQEDPDRIHWVEWFPFSCDELEGRKALGGSGYRQLTLPFFEEHRGYYSHVLTPTSAPELSYTYGERLFNFEGVNQIQSVINELRATSYSRRAVASLWHPGKDHASPSPPCLDLVQFEVRDGKLHLTAYIRSNDMYRAWPQNAFALRKLQGLVAEQIGGCALGDTITISNSAHVYEDSWDRAKTVVLGHFPHVDRGLPRDGRDPRGDFAIRNEDGQIILEHYSRGGERLATLTGKTARGLSRELLTFVSSKDHAFYLGSELQKAETALRQGIKYAQDRPLRLCTKRPSA